MKNTKKIVTLAVLVALGSILGILDRGISALIIPFLPGAKIGLANIVVLIAIRNYRFHESLILVILKAIIVGLLFGSIMTFIIGGTASIMAFFAMYLLNKLFNQKMSVIGISVAGGFVHIITQLLVIMISYSMGREVMAYGAFLIIVSLITSVIIGYTVIRLEPILFRYLKEQED